MSVMCIQNLMVHFTLQWPFVIQVCWIAEHEESFKGKKQFESVRGDGYQQWKGESWLHEGLRLKVNECLYIAALQFEPHTHKRNEREKLMPLWIGIIFLRHPRIRCLVLSWVKCVSSYSTESFNHGGQCFRGQS